MARPEDCAVYCRTQLSNQSLEHPTTRWFVTVYALQLNEDRDKRTCTCSNLDTSRPTAIHTNCPQVSLPNPPQYGHACRVFRERERRSTLDSSRATAIHTNYITTFSPPNTVNNPTVHQKPPPPSNCPQLSLPNPPTVQSTTTAVHVGEKHTTNTPPTHCLLRVTGVLQVARPGGVIAPPLKWPILICSQG